MNDELEPEMVPSEDEDEELIFPERPPFDNQDLINAHYLRNTDLKKALIDKVDEALLYESAKRALKILIMNYFDQDWFLANLEKGGRDSSSTIDELLDAKYSFEIDAITSTASMCKSDINSPVLLNIMSALRGHFKIAILSRAKGPNRERILNKVQTIEQIVTKRNETPQPRQEPSKRKYGIF